MRGLTVDRRYATLTAFVIERQAAITDLAIDIFCKLKGSTRRKAAISRKERLLKDTEILDGVAIAHLKIGAALIAARESGSDPSSAIAALLGWDGPLASMACRASGLNLVVNAIVPWNTVYLSRAVDCVRVQSIVISDDLLSQVAPLPWAHIALTGDYL